MWLGVLRLRRSDEGSKQLGFALIFANFPINRIAFALLHMNDEQYLTAHFFGNSDIAFWVTNLVIWLFTVPPIILAYLAIQNRMRPFWFLAFFILPFAFVFVFAGMFLENWLLLDKKFLATAIIGVPILSSLWKRSAWCCSFCFAGIFASRRGLRATETGLTAGNEAGRSRSSYARPNAGYARPPKFRFPTSPLPRANASATP